MKTKILFLLVAIGIIVASCNNRTENTDEQNGKVPSVQIKPEEFTEVADGVYYFKLADVSAWNNYEQLSIALPKFITSHKELRIISATTDSFGYWIITAPRIPCPCDTIK